MRCPARRSSDCPARRTSARSGSSASAGTCSDGPGPGPASHAICPKRGTTRRSRPATIRWWCCATRPERYAHSTTSAGTAGRSSWKAPAGWTPHASYAPITGGPMASTAPCGQCPSTRTAFRASTPGTTPCFPRRSASSEAWCSCTRIPAPISASGVPIWNRSPGRTGSSGCAPGPRSPTKCAATGRSSSRTPSTATTWPTCMTGPSAVPGPTATYGTCTAVTSCGTRRRPAARPACPKQSPEASKPCRMADIWSNVHTSRSGRLRVAAIRTRTAPDSTRCTAPPDPRIEQRASRLPWPRRRRYRRSVSLSPGRRTGLPVHSIRAWRLPVRRAGNRSGG